MARVSTIQGRFGKRVRDIRRAAGLTQAQLAKRAGMDQKYVGAVERGERNVTLGLVDRLARALAAEPVQLFYFDEAGVVPPEKISSSWLQERMRTARPEARKLLSGIAVLAFELAALDEKKRVP